MQKILDFVLDILWPKTCVSCGKLNCFICSNCYEKIEFFTLPIKLELQPCYLDQVWTVGAYKEPLSTLVKTLKYQGVKDIGNLLAVIAYETTNFPKTNLISCVPLHRKKLRQRGFNQAEIMAQKLAKLTNVPYKQLLIRSSNDQPQAGIADRSQRLSRLTNSFTAVEQNFDIATNQSSILVIDDVLTTGTTLNECAKILKSIGFGKVYGLTIAHEG